MEEQDWNSEIEKADWQGLGQREGVEGNYPHVLRERSGGAFWKSFQNITRMCMNYWKKKKFVPIRKVNDPTGIVYC